MHRLVFTAVLLAASTAALAQTQKVPEFIKPYPGQKPYSDPKVKDFDEIFVPEKKVDAEPPSAGWKKLDGKILQFHFDMPEGRSTLEVFKNYQEALSKAGFETVFTCSDKECGSFSGHTRTWEGAMNGFISANVRYTLTRLARPQGTVWAAIVVSPVGLPLTKVIVVEEKAMETGKVLVDVAALKKGIEEFGFVVVGGIEFETGKATLLPSSTPALEEVKKLLDATPSLKLYVVGHTDEVGSESANVALSNSRAAAVVKELTTRYKISNTRLKSAGVGPYVPVASNRNEQGRARNRRVVLVEDLP